MVSSNTERVAIDVAPVRAEPAGVGLYVALLTRELVTTNALPLALIGVRPDARGLATPNALPRALIGGRPDARALAGFGDALPRKTFSARTYHAGMQLAAERDARSLGARLVHFTNAAAPLSSDIPYVLTVHDLSVARMPMTHPVARWGIVPVNLVAMARAATVIVPSDWTGRELGRIGVSPRRIVVVPHAPALAPGA